MIKESGCFVVNIVSKDLKETYSYLGTNSGRDFDKIEELGLKVDESIEINAPILSDFSADANHCEMQRQGIAMF